jgi:putative selenate reductase
MADWIDNIDRALDEAGCASLAAFAGNRSDNVGRAASDALSHPRYKNGAFAHGLPKVETGLGAWDCVVAPCVAACAVEQDVPEYAWLIAQGDYDRALEVILARNPLPGATGYACTRLCETKCTRNDYEATVAIRALKRIASERGSTRYVASRAAASGRRVAIVGAGPSGLAAAAFLAINGVSVTVFESSDVAGGMLRAIPPFRLPSAVIDRDIERITELGVTIQLRTPVTDPPEAMLQAGFDAVYLAAGFQRATPLRVPGIDGPGVIVALDLLDRARRGLPVGLGQRVVVIGGGDTAMDAARTAQRLGGHPVTIVYRRSRAEMPAAPEELEGAFEEGNTLEELVTPLEILRSGDTITGVRCVRNRLDAPGPDGRPVPRPVAGSEFIVPCDTVVVAVGQLPELSFLDGSGVTRHAGGGVTVDDSTGCAGIASVYAGGDMVVEPASIIAACADGRRAAEGICTRFGIDFTPPASRPAGLSNQEILEVKRTRTRRVAPQIQPLTPPLDRKGFALVESTMSDESARLEALRCVQCTTFCDKCVEVCPNRSNYTCFITPVQWQLPLLVTNGGRVVVAGHERFTVSQPRQIVHVDDFCNECDNCQTFCVHRGRPYADKPRLFLDEHAFAADAGLAFHIAGETIRRRDNGAESRLTACADGWTFEDEHASLRVSREWSLLAATLKAPFAGTRSLRPAADMAVLYEGVMSTLPFLTIGR